MSIHLMIAMATAGLSALALLGSSYVLFFALLGQRMRRWQDGKSNAPEPRTCFLVLVPAHNEQEGIRPTLRGLRSVDYPAGLCRVIVIADNCDDETAAVVREEGFECWVRNNPESRGKGQALRWAFDRARKLPFDAAVVFDADSTADPCFLIACDRELGKGARVLQGRNEFQLADRSGFSLLTAASKRAENRLFWKPRQCLGLLIFLQGNGFCMKRDVIEQVPWNAYSIVEDLEYSLMLAVRGVRVHFADSARVTSRMTRSRSAAVPQRLRGASGVWQVMARYVPVMFATAVKKRRPLLAEAAIALALHSRPVLIYLTLLAFFLSLMDLQAPWCAIARGLVAGTFAVQFTYFAFLIGTVTDEKHKWFSVASAFLSLPAYIGWLLVVQCLAVLGVKRTVWARSPR